MWPRPEYHLDFAQPQFAWQALRWPGVCLVLVLAVAMTFGYGQLHMQQQQLALLQARQDARLAAHAQAMRMTAAALPSQGADRARRSEQSAQAASGIHLPEATQKALSRMRQQRQWQWFGLLKALESSQRPEIALLQLIPDPSRAQFTLAGEAKSYADLLGYVAQLQGLEGVYDVHLQKHQSIDSHPQHPVSFEIQGGWQP